MFTPFSQFPNIICTTSTKLDGSMKDRSGFNENNIHVLATKLGIDPKYMVFMKQIHSGEIRTIVNTNEHIIQNVDGLITNQPNVFLSVVTADCLPIVFFDPEKKVIGAVHAGYKGLLNHIIEHMVDKMEKEFGVVRTSIQVGIGPGIGKCCYNVDETRAQLFRDFLPTHPEIVQTRDTELFLDLLRVAEVVLGACGVAPRQIRKSTICTKDANNTYFSYRRESSQTYGEMMTVIGMI
ncbi:peptidoglycan editing factor PgeF [soil metagenome]